jgi:hypothetical protein
MTKIKVYDIAEFIKQKQPSQRVHYHKTLAIIHSEKGAIVFDYEGVGWQPSSIDEKITMGVVDAPEDDKLLVEFILPQHTVDVPVKDLLTANYFEMYLTDFMTKYKYNYRCKVNFTEILRSIAKLGLNPDDYYIKEGE